jgi:hypothetical protein
VLAALCATQITSWGVLYYALPRADRRHHDHYQVIDTGHHERVVGQPTGCR